MAEPKFKMQPHDYIPGRHGWCTTCGQSEKGEGHSTSPDDDLPEVWPPPVAAPVERPPEVANVKVDLIVFHPRNIRRNLGDLRELGASIKSEGLLQPVLLHRIGGKLQLVDGHRRVAAARLVDVKRLPAMIVDQLTDGQVIGKALATGMFKKDISKEERRAALQSMVNEHGYTVDDLATRYGVSAATIRKWMKPPEVQARSNGGIVNAKQLHHVVRDWWTKAGRGEVSDDVQQLLHELEPLLPVAMRAGEVAG